MSDLDRLKDLYYSVGDQDAVQLKIKRETISFGVCGHCDKRCKKFCITYHLIVNDRYEGYRYIYLCGDLDSAWQMQHLIKSAKKSPGQKV